MEEEEEEEKDALTRCWQNAVITDVYAGWHDMKFGLRVADVDMVEGREGGREGMVLKESGTLTY